ncbi:MAG TPA: hypothetical protein DCX06_00685 [Opitutae bacterium]|nr:hypothetical protein [Opitutae bacterium]
MKTYPTIDECRGYVAAQLAKPNSTKHTPRLPAITISRQAGARGRMIAHKLQMSLNAETPNEYIPWGLFDENLVQKVLEDHDLPTDLEKFMPEAAVSEFESSINEILGRHPSMWSLFEKTTRTIVRLSQMGRCIVVGRAGNMITHGMSNVLRVRLIGNEVNRTYHMVHAHGMSETEAKQFIRDEDRSRSAYVKQHFHCDINDPQTYDLVINTDHLNDDHIVNMLVEGVNCLGA